MVGQRICLQDRDIDVFKHIQRYRLTVYKALERQPFFHGCGPYAVQNVLKRLCGAGYLDSAPLYGRLHYYFLTPKARPYLPERLEDTGPLNSEPKVRAYSVLSFCCLREPQHERLTKQEFKAQFPQFYRRGERINYYIDEEGPVPRLGYLRVDYGGASGRWDLLIARLAEDIGQRLRCREFNQLVQNRGFVFTILTALSQKAERIKAASQEADLPVPVRVCVIPELRDLIGFSPDAPARDTEQEEDD